jgi:hypothetical protein
MVNTTESDIVRDALKLILKRIAKDDHAVLYGNRSAGRIMLKLKTFGQSVWLWTITGPYVPAQLQPSHGEAQTLEDAKLAFKGKFEAVIALGEREGKAIVWVGVV